MITMTEASQKLLDPIGLRIIDELQQNARLPFTELGRRVGLSTPAVMERVRRLEEANIILGYRARINASLIGYSIHAFITLDNVDGPTLPKLSRITKALPEVLECHRLTGEKSFILRVVAASISDLERIIDRLSPFVATSTSLVLSTTLFDRILVPHLADDER
jgi:Lrp/AsnC family transcriptional regulator, leucine-responsive regulatory protein